MVFLQCVLMWVFRSPLDRKPCLHWLNWHGFSTVCVLKCFLRWHYDFESLITHVKLIFFLLSRCPKMYFNLVLCQESLKTLAALIMFFPSAWPHENFKICSTKESLIRLADLIKFLPSMCPQMDFKVTIYWKVLIALAVLIWPFPFPSMFTHVYF